MPQKYNRNKPRKCHTNSAQKTITKAKSTQKKCKISRHNTYNTKSTNRTQTEDRQYFQTAYNNTYGHCQHRTVCLFSGWRKFPVFKKVFKTKTWTNDITTSVVMSNADWLRRRFHFTTAVVKQWCPNGRWRLGSRVLPIGQYLVPDGSVTCHGVSRAFNNLI